MKTCTVCGESKNYSDFHKDKRTPEGYGYRCKLCTSSYYKGYNASRKAAKARTEPSSKICRQCNLEKPISQFGKKSTSLDKHQIYCKPCWRERVYESMKRNAR